MIFNLFKSKPTLKDLIPEGFVDIHSHILPGIDDGAKNIEDSLVLISEMRELGFSKIIGTPHTYPGLHDNTKKTIKDSFEKLKNNKPDKIQLGYASEYMLDESIIEKANEKELLCIEKNYVLIELSFISAPYNLYEIIFNMRVNDYIPILAHPERYIYLSTNKKNYFKLIDAGCKFQINLLSLTGHYGNNVVNICDKLLELDLIKFSGSDIHTLRHIRGFNEKLKIKNIKIFERILENNMIFQ